MTTQYLERIDSRSMSRQNKGMDDESYSASRTFLVYDDAGGSLSLASAINYSGGVSFGDSHPDAVSILATAFDISPVSDRKGTWVITWSYELPKEDEEEESDGDNTEVEPEDDELEEPAEDISGGGNEDGTDDEGTDDETDEEEEPFTGVSMTTGLALVDGFVAGATVPTDGDQGGVAGYEITDGTVIHQGGDPVTIPVSTMEISFSKIVKRQTYYFNGIHAKAGKRNAFPFYGFDTGSMIFKGMSVQRSTVDTWDVTYDFAWDEWLHMRQVPRRDDDGQLDWDLSVDPPELPIYFKQPFPNKISFAFSP